MSCGNILPQSICGRFIALMSILKMFVLFLYLLYRRMVYVRCFYAYAPTKKVIKVIFYCHFPDSLLCTERNSWLKRQYRRVLDWLDEVTTGSAEEICVNSKFTLSVVRKTFPSLRNRTLHVLYPPVDYSTIQRNKAGIENWSQMKAQFPSELKDLSPDNYVISLNRYERKKGHERALRAMLFAKDNIKDQELPTLVIAGGWDARVKENHDVYEELRQEASKYEKTHNIKVVFMQSIKDTLRWCLLRHALAVIYTPSNEHFGIVPLESMAMGRPVIACASGGPLESCVNNVTGYVCADKDEDTVVVEFGNALKKLLNRSPEDIEKQRIACEKRVRNHFGLEMFTESLASIINKKCIS